MFKRIIKLLVGAGIAQVITFSLLPIITRLYEPEDISLLNMFVSLTTVIAMISTMSLNHAIPMMKFKKELKSLVFIVSISWFVISLIYLVIMAFYPSNNKGIYIYAPIASFVLCMSMIIEGILYRGQDVSTPSRSLVFQAASNNLLKCILGIEFSTALSLIISTMVGNLVRLLSLVRGSLRTFDFKGISHVKIKNIYFVIFKYSDYWKYRLPQVVVNYFSQQLVVFVLALIVSYEASGNYVLAYTVLMIPAVVIGQSLVNVLYPNFVGIGINEDALKILVKYTLVLVVVGLLLCIVLFFHIENMFLFIFGDGWDNAGTFASYLLLFIALMIASRPAISLIPILNMEKQFFIFECIALTFKILFIIIIYKLTDNVYYSVLSYSMVTSMSYVVLIVMVYMKLKGTIDGFKENFNSNAYS